MCEARSSLADEILCCIGKKFKATEEQKMIFSRCVAEELENLINVSKIAFPSREETQMLLDLADRIDASRTDRKQIAGEIEALKTQNSFSGAIIRLVARQSRTTTPNCPKPLNTALLRQLVFNVRFRNIAAGRDARLAKEASFLIARHYLRAFHKMPSLSGTGQREDGSAKNTTYQHVCALAANKLCINIGISSQKQAISKLKATTYESLFETSYHPYIKSADLIAEKNIFNPHT